MYRIDVCVCVLHVCICVCVVWVCVYVCTHVCDECVHTHIYNSHSYLYHHALLKPNSCDSSTANAAPGIYSSFPPFLYSDFLPLTLKSHGPVIDILAYWITPLPCNQSLRDPPTSWLTWPFRAGPSSSTLKGASPIPEHHCPTHSGPPRMSSASTLVMDGQAEPLSPDSGFPIPHCTP